MTLVVIEVLFSLDTLTYQLADCRYSLTYCPAVFSFPSMINHQSIVPLYILIFKGVANGLREVPRYSILVHSHLPNVTSGVPDRRGEVGMDKAANHHTLIRRNA